MTTPMRALRLAALALLFAIPAAGQGSNGSSATTGLLFKSYSFGDANTLQKASQVAIPLSAIIPINGRLSVDFGTYYATTSTTSATDGDHSVSGLTDLQARGTYTLGRDQGVVTVLVNVPSGTKFNVADATTAGAAASNFLLFPVNSYSNGFSVTTGLGIAKRVGVWGIGIAGSFRWAAKYSPYSDTTVSYSPGTEGRIRIGADRNIGQGRIRFGLTYSTFGNDTYGAGGGADTKYAPGSRFVAEGAYTWPGLGGTATAYVWNYHRSSGADSTSLNNGENILTAGVITRRPLNPNTTLEPAIEGRFWSYNQGDGGGKVVALVAALRRRVNDHLSLVPGVRAEFGSLDLLGGNTASLSGFGASVYLRYGF